MKSTKNYDYNPNRYNANSHTGRFNKRIALYGPVIIQDEIGNEIESFGELSVVWSMVKTTKGSEYIEAARNNITNVTRFVVRYSDELNTLFQTDKTRLQIKYKNVDYDVKSIINDDEMNKTFTIVTQGRL